MANYNLTQTGDEVQAYIDSIPVIDVTGTLNGSAISFGSNPYSQIAANYAADCSSIVRLTVGTAVYLLRVTQYDGTNYTAAEMSGAHNVVATIGSSSASATIDAGIDATPTQGSDNLVKSGGVAEGILQSTLTDEVKGTNIYPNCDIHVGQGSQVGGTFNAWYGWAKSGGLEEAGWLKEIHIGTGSLVAYSNIPCRVSQFVYNGTTLTGLKTIHEFTINIPIGNGVVDVRDKNIWFEKDYCLEINFAAIGNIIKSTNLDIMYRPAPLPPYVRFNDQVLTSGSIWKIDVVVESMVSVQDKLEENSAQIEVLDNKERVLFPNFTNVNSIASGAINAWWGFSTKDDLPSDGYIYGVKVCEANVKTSATTINFRISKKVRDSSGAITGCTTIKEFSAVLAAGATEVHFAPMRFLKDYVLETNIYDFRYIAQSTNFTIRFRSSAADGIRYVKYVGQSVSTGSIWKIDAILTLDKELPPLNVLIIGNSYSEDAFTYVPQLIKNDVNLTLGILYYGGASLAQHNTFLTNEDAVYDYEKCVGDGQWVSQSSKSIQFALADVKWDVIILQQKGSAVVTGGVKNDLNTFISNLFSHLDHNVKLGWHFTLAWDTTLSTSITHYNSMVSVVQSEVIEGSCIRWIIPTATAIQNARTTSLQSLGSGGNLMYTDTHAQEGIPCYILACAAAESILTEMGIQASIFANNIRPVQAWITACNVPHQNGTSVGVSDANCRIAQMAALQAIKFPFVITDCSTL